MYCILLVEFRRFLPDSTTAMATAEALYSHKPVQETNIKVVATKITEMMTKGHKYLNLEARLGKGFCVVIGAQLSETM